MTPILDNKGNRLDGLFRSSCNSISVKNDLEYNKYIRTKTILDNTNKKIEDLVSQVSQMNNILSSIIKEKA
jgi:hypothetical protein